LKLAVQRRTILPQTQSALLAAIAIARGDAERQIEERAASIRADNDRELLFKLALWRWSAPNLPDPLAAMTRRDALMCSLFRDLAERIGEKSVAMPMDLLTDFMHADK